MSDIAADRQVVARAYVREPKIFRVGADVIPHPWPEAPYGEFEPLTGPYVKEPDVPFDVRRNRAAKRLRNRALLRFEHDEVDCGKEVIIFWDEIVDEEHRLYCVCGDVQSGILDRFDIVNVEEVSGGSESGQ